MDRANTKTNTATDTPLLVDNMTLICLAGNYSGNGAYVDTRGTTIAFRIDIGF
jgi:hypothetical protein